MKVFACIANNNGIAFNGRALSRDAVVCEKILQVVKNHPFVVIGNQPGSSLKEEQLIETVNANCEKYADEEVYCFISGLDIGPVIDKTDTLYLIHWNRDYPADTFFNQEWLNDYSLKNTTKFKGNSHKEITMEEWIRCVS